jgi:hypothetical protein
MIRITRERHSKFQLRKHPKTGEYDLDKQFLINLYNEQDGRCKISGVKMVFNATSDWMASVERIDDSVTYRRDNVTLIVTELNSAQKWTAEKFKFAVDAYLLIKMNTSTSNEEPLDSQAVHNGQADDTQT